MKMYNCNYCGKENKWGSSKFNKYCNTVCKAAWEWLNITIPRVERGECTHNSVTVLKRYLVETRGEKCEECGIQNTWNNKPLVLQLDHINGNSDNNFPSNIRLLCPNCHSQTHTFGNGGKGNRYKKVSKRNQYLQEYKK